MKALATIPLLIKIYLANQFPVSYGTLRTRLYTLPSQDGQFDTESMAYKISSGAGSQFRNKLVNILFGNNENGRKIDLDDLVFNNTHYKHESFYIGQNLEEINDFYKHGVDTMNIYESDSADHDTSENVVCEECLRETYFKGQNDT